MSIEPAARSALVAAQPNLTAYEQQSIVANLTNSRSPATRRAYHNDWKRFQHWCELHGYDPLPAHPHTVAAYLSEAAALQCPGKTPDELMPRYAPTTMSRWVAGINHRHRYAGLHEPGRAEIVREVLDGIKNTSTRTTRKARALVTNDIIDIITTARANAAEEGWVAGIFERRDSAIILTMFPGALRRTAAADLKISDIHWDHDYGIHLDLRRSKTDQTGEGDTLAIPRGTTIDTCPICALHRWLEALLAWDRTGKPGLIRLHKTAPPLTDHVCAKPLPLVPARLREAPLFRGVHRGGRISAEKLSGESIAARIVNRAQATKKFTADELDEIAGHSLRAGMVTQALKNGASPVEIMKQTKHKSVRMVLEYDRNTPEVGNAVNQLGL